MYFWNVLKIPVRLLADSPAYSGFSSTLKRMTRPVEEFSRLMHDIYR